MRTFIAIDLTDEIKDELAQLQARLKYSGADVKWVAKDNIHLTLKFLGEVPDEKIEKVSSELDMAAKETKQFEMTINDIGAFPKLDFPRVVWVGLDKGAAESKELAQKIDERLERLGIQRESRAFSPHITIGRVKSAKNKAALKEKILCSQLSTINYQLVSSIILFKSTLTSTGPIYTKLHESRFKS